MHSEYYSRNISLGILLSEYFSQNIMLSEDFSRNIVRNITCEILPLEYRFHNITLEQLPCENYS